MKEKIYATDLSPRECEERLRDRLIFQSADYYALTVKNQDGKILLLPNIRVKYGAKFDVWLENNEINVTRHASRRYIVLLIVLLIITAELFLIAIPIAILDNFFSQQKEWKMIDRFCRDQLNARPVEE